MKVSKILSPACGYVKLFGLRGLYRRAVVAAGGNPLFSVCIQDKTQVVLRFGTTDVAAYEHVFINQEYDIGLSDVPRTIIDAGANIGLSSVFFALRYLEARIVALEPDPSNFDILLRNCAPFERITPLHVALWDKDGYVSMDDPGGGHWALRVKESQAGQIRAMSLPTLLAERGIEFVDLLKMDIEGAEIEVLKTSPQWIDRIGAICTELHDRFRPGCTGAFDEAVRPRKRWKRGELTCALL